MDAFADRVVFQTREWLEFLARTQRAQPVVATVMDDGEHVGYFTGLIIRRMGLRILGSPFPGWTTESMGFNLERGREPARRRGRAGPLRVPGARLRARRAQGPPAEARRSRRPAVRQPAHADVRGGPVRRGGGDLRADVERLPARGAQGREGRRHRRAGGGRLVRGGVLRAARGRVRPAIARAALRRRARPRAHRVPASRPVACCCSARARREGLPIATGIFPAFNGTAYFWGGASVREHQILRPNEAIFWHAMRYWRGRGMTALDLGGGGDYKRRYGPRELRLPLFRRSRFPGLPAPAGGRPRGRRAAPGPARAPAGPSGACRRRAACE